jgi:DNA-binding SARP family transcriptional activator
MRYFKHQGLYEKSLYYGQQILKYEPTHEAVHREIMHIYQMSGRQTLAIRQYQLCRDILAEELDMPPLEETEALYLKLLGQSSDPALVSLSKADVRETLQQLGSALRGLQEAHLQFNQAKDRFDEAHGRLQRTLTRLERWLK